MYMNSFLKQLMLVVLMTSAFAEELTDIATTSSSAVRRGIASTQTAGDVVCGQTLTQSVKLKNDLNCVNFSGPILKIEGKDVEVDGAGFKLSGGPKSTGVEIRGINLKLKNLKIMGPQLGVVVKDSDKVELSHNWVSYTEVGVLVVGLKEKTRNVIVINNHLTRNEKHALKSEGLVESVVVVENDLSESGQEALWIEADKLSLGGEMNNNFYRSQRALFFQGQDVELKNLSFTKSLLSSHPVVIKKTNRARISNVDLGTSLPVSPKDNLTGLLLDEVKSFEVTKLKAQNFTVGLEISTSKGVESTGRVKQSEFLFNTLGGILIISHDQTPMGYLDLSGNRYQIDENVADEILIDYDTRLGTASRL